MGYGIPKGAFGPWPRRSPAPLRTWGVAFTSTARCSASPYKAPRPQGVVLAHGETVAADGVVVNGDFARAVQDLLPASARGKYSDRYFARKQFSCSTFMLYLGLDRRYDHLPHHQLYLSDHIRRRDRPFIDDSALDAVNPPFYVCNPTPTDPSNAPSGHSTLYVLVPIPHTGHGVNWAKEQRAYRDLVISRLPKLGFDGVADHIQSETCYTADTWRDDYSVYLGAVFNLSHGLTQLGPFRPPIRSETVAGALLGRRCGPPRQRPNDDFGGGQAHGAICAIGLARLTSHAPSPPGLPLIHISKLPSTGRSPAIAAPLKRGLSQNRHCNVPLFKGGWGDLNPDNRLKKNFCISGSLLGGGPVGRGGFSEI
jgi:hypothetical protein